MKTGKPYSNVKPVFLKDNNTYIVCFCFRKMAAIYSRGDDDFSGQFFRIFEIIIFRCVVAICDLVHDVETIFHLSYVLTASGNLF